MTVRSFVRAVPALLVLCAWSTGGWAHAACKRGDPAPGAVINEAPTRISLQCDSALEMAFSQVLVEDANGKQVDKGGLQGDPKDPKHLILPLPPLEPGTYKVIWSVVARDGHRTKGNYQFTIR